MEAGRKEACSESRRGLLEGEDREVEEADSLWSLEKEVCMYRLSEYIRKSKDVDGGADEIRNNAGCFGGWTS